MGHRALHAETFAVHLCYFQTISIKKLATKLGGRQGTTEAVYLHAAGVDSMQAGEPSVVPHMSHNMAVTAARPGPEGLMPATVCSERQQCEGFKWS
jgi:hypothetical protein